MSDETVVWKGRPSQLLNFVPFALCIVIDLALIGGAFVSPFLLLLTIFPLIYLVWTYLKVHCRVFELTSQREQRKKMYVGRAEVRLSPDGKWALATARNGAVLYDLTKVLR